MQDEDERKLAEAKGETVNANNSSANTPKIVRLGAFETDEDKKERNFHFFGMILIAFGVYFLLKSFVAF